MHDGPTNVAGLKGKVDFGIITIREDEFQAVLDRLPVETTAVGRQRYAMSRLRTVSDDEYLIATVRCLEQGTNQAQEVARILIDEVDPQWILIVGIAGSLPGDEYTIGDVLLATRLHDYSVSALIENKDGTVRHEFSDMGGPMHRDVQSLLAYLPALPLIEWWKEELIGVPRPNIKFGKDCFYGDPAWSKKVRECLGRYFGKKAIRNRPKAFTGSVVSSGILLKDTQTAQLWLKSSRDIRGIEMELSGVYRAAWNDHKPVLAIRGISDVVGYKRSPEWTNYACNTAASFMVALLRSRPIKPAETEVEQPEPEEKDELGQSRPVGIFKRRPENPAPLPRKEHLFSNLLKVSYFPDKLYAIETDCKDAGEVWAKLRSKDENPPCDWFYRGKSIYAFHAFTDPVWQEFRDSNEPSEEETMHWSDSQDQDRIYEFVELLKNCLKQLSRESGLRYMHTQRVRGEVRGFKYIYFEASSEFEGLPWLSSKDLIDVDKLVLALQTKDSPFSKHILAKLPSKTSKLVRQHPNSSQNGFVGELVRGLNEVIKKPLFDSLAFEDANIRWDAKNLLKKVSISEEELRKLNRMLIEDVFRGLVQRRVLRAKAVRERSLVKDGEPEVFKPVFSKAGRFQYYRHHAFRPEFVRFEGSWFLEITPTYHYTSNGFSVSYFYEDLVSGIKKLERSGAVFRQVLFWSRVLQDSESRLVEKRSYPHLRFGNLLEYPMDYGILESLWLNREPSSDADGSPRRRPPRSGRRQKKNDSQESNSLFRGL